MLRGLSRAAIGLIAVSLPLTVPAGDAEIGAAKAQTCLGCHGVPGYRNAYPEYRVPKIGGQTQQYLEDALRAYRDGGRDHPTMRAQARRLSDQDIQDIAAFFAGESE